VNIARFVSSGLHVIRQALCCDGAAHGGLGYTKLAGGFSDAALLLMPTPVRSLTFNCAIVAQLNISPIPLQPPHRQFRTPAKFTAPIRFRQVGSLKVLAERRIGEELANADLAKGTAGMGRPPIGGRADLPPNPAPTLAEIGISILRRCRF
jgi:hypothetical protein